MLKFIGFNSCLHDGIKKLDKRLIYKMQEFIYSIEELKQFRKVFVKIFLRLL